MKKRTSKQIFAEALLELSRETHLEDITIKQLIDASGLSVQTFYNHFKDKRELVFWIYQQEIDGILSMYGQEGITFEEIIRQGFSFYNQEASFFKDALLMSGGDVPFQTRIAEYNVERWTEIIEKRFGKELSEEERFALRMYCFASVGMAGEWVLRNETLPIETIARYIWENMPKRLEPYLAEENV